MRFKRHGIAILVVTLFLALFHPIAAEAKSKGQVLFYGPATFGEVPELEVARALGLEPIIATDEEWRQLKESDFRKFEALVFPDPFCSQFASLLDTAEDTGIAWSGAVERGNQVLMGTDLALHDRQQLPAARTMIRNSLEYAVAGKRTGLFFSLSCYYATAEAGTPVPSLSALGRFVVQGQFAPPLDGCPGEVDVLLPRHPVMRGLTDASLSGWDCSPHEVFAEYPSAYRAVAAESGLAFVLARDGRG